MIPLTSPRNRGRSPTVYSKATNAATTATTAKGTYRINRSGSGSNPACGGLADVDEDFDDDDDDGDSSGEDPMDEDDQRALVESHHKEAAAQGRFFQAAFGYGIGSFAVAMSAFLPLLCREECAASGAVPCWGHAAYSCLAHAWAVWPFIFCRPKQQEGGASAAAGNLPPPSSARDPDRHLAVGLALQLVPPVLWLAGAFDRDEDHFHLGLMIGNLVTYGGAWLILWDARCTDRLLRDLRDAQYKHKSL